MFINVKIFIEGIYPQLHRLMYSYSADNAERIISTILESKHAANYLSTIIHPTHDDIHLALGKYIISNARLSKILAEPNLPAGWDDVMPYIYREIRDLSRICHKDLSDIIIRARFSRIVSKIMEIDSVKAYRVINKSSTDGILILCFLSIARSINHIRRSPLLYVAVTEDLFNNYRFMNFGAEEGSDEESAPE